MKSSNETNSLSFAPNFTVSRGPSRARKLKCGNPTQALWAWFTLAIAAIYTLLAIAFGSYLQPLIVMAASLFGIVGAVIGHILLGYDLSLISLMGVIALSGVSQTSSAVS